jgi:hypothetical protein
MPSSWSKQAQQLGPVRYFNAGAGMSVIGGEITGVPSNVGANQGGQDRPGDRIIIGEEDALALSDTSIGTLYGGLYQYVTTKSGAVAAATRGKACFWDTAVANKLFQVTPDESGAQGVAMFAGVYINTLTAGNSWWIQQAGKVFVRMKAVFTGIPANGCAVYLAEAGAGEPGVFDVLDGGGNPSFTQVGSMLKNYAGVAEGVPVAAGIGIPINIPLCRNFRW